MSRSRYYVLIALAMLGAISLTSTAAAQEGEGGPSEIPAGVYEAPVVREPPPAAPPIGLRGTTTRRPLSVNRIGHSSVLVDFDGQTVLTDPWFTEAPYFHHGEALGMGVSDLPRLTAIVASHAHFDHFHIEGMAAYPHKDVPVIVGFQDMAARARAVGFTDVRVVRPNRTLRLGNVRVTALFGDHGVPEVTFLLRSGGNSVYFGGDTLLTPRVQAIARRYAPVDVALLSVNGLRTEGQPVVMTSEEAAVFAGMLRAKVAIPTHYAFRGGRETEGILSYNGTAERFLVNLRRMAPGTRGRILEPGQLQRFVARRSR